MLSDSVPKVGLFSKKEQEFHYIVFLVENNKKLNTSN